MLGIKLELDKASLKKASKLLSKPTDKKKVTKQDRTTSSLLGGIIGGEVAKEAEKKDKGKTEGKSAALGGAIGGLVGSLLSALKPIQELLGVIGGILQIFLVPVLNLLKPFLVFFLWLGLRMKEFFSPENNQADQGTYLESGTVKGDMIEGTAGESFGNLKDKFNNWLESVFDPIGASSIFEAVMTIFAGTFVAGLGNILFGFLDILGGVWDVFIGLLNGDMETVIQGIINIFNGIWQIFVGILKAGVGFLGMIMTFVAQFFFTLYSGVKNAITNGMNFVAQIGSWIYNTMVDVLTKSLSALSGIGSWIWNKIKSYFGGGGGSSTSVNDALITSDGNVVHLNRNDNVLAFQDFSQLESYTNSNSGNSAGNVTIQVTGFVGDEQELADKISTMLNKYSRGGSSNY